MQQLLKITALCIWLGLSLTAQAQYALPEELSPWEVTHHSGNGTQFPMETIFMDNFPLSSPSPDAPSSVILDREGDLLWYDSFVFRKIGFTLLDNGRMVYSQNNDYIFLDSNFLIVDTLTCALGRITDLHEVIADHRGHYFILCFEDTTADLSAATTVGGLPGDTAGIIRYHTVQEFDPAFNFVKEWHSKNYFLPEEVDSNFFLNPSFLELMHTNSIDVDTNGQVLISNREMSEVTCIDWASGDINWRLGGVANEFTFINDPGPSAQHDARFLPGGRISIFDNGNFHTPHRSRGIIYDLDTANRIATPVQEFIAPSQASTAMGSFQALPNGEGLVCWGVSAPTPPINFSYMLDDSTPQMEFKYTENYKTYRARGFDLPFQFDRPFISCDAGPNGATLTVNGNPTTAKWSDGSVGTSIMVTDTGWYSVFVPKGIGWAVSKPVHIADLASPCLAVGIDEELVPARKLLGTWDLLGRPVVQFRSGQIYLRRYTDGSSEKLMLLE